jgi:hypothetical protein
MRSAAVAPLFDVYPAPRALMNERRPGRILWRSQRASGDFNHEMDPFRYDGQALQRVSTQKAKINIERADGIWLNLFLSDWISEKLFEWLFIQAWLSRSLYWREINLKMNK